MDFLSNGFHQLYAELEDEFISWELEDTSPVCSVLSNNSCNSDYYEYVDQQEDFKFNNFLINDAGSTTFDTFQMEFDQNNDYNTCINLTDTNWENTFLENYIEIPHLIDLLPDRTPLCSDSCDIFLKESSHNLSKFRPDNITDPLCNLKEPPETEAEKTFPCTYGNCSKVYAKPAHLKAHIRRHLGDKPYVCTWPNCTWKFSRSDELARHRRSHSGVKPYKCTYCTKCFARSDHLSKHRKVHERKMTANKLKGYFLSNLRDHHVRPGRKPKDVNSF